MLFRSGKAVIKLRNILEDKVETYHVSGDCPEIVDIPPGYTHSIENVGQGELIAIFWAGEIFDPKDPDTIITRYKLYEEIKNYDNSWNAA